MNRLTNAVAACVLSTVLVSGALAGAVHTSTSTDPVVALADASLATGMVKTSALTSSMASTRSRAADAPSTSTASTPAEDPADLDAMALLAGLVLVAGIAMRRLRS